LKAHEDKYLLQLRFSAGLTCSNHTVILRKPSYVSLCAEHLWLPANAFKQVNRRDCC